MRISYYPETDSMYIDLSAKESSESREVSPGVVLDYDDENNLVGIDTAILILAITATGNTIKN